MSTLLCILSFLAADPPAADRPSIVARECPAPVEDRREILADDDYLFASVNYGSKGDREAALYVKSKRSGAWRRITEISTEGAVFGRSPSFEEYKAAGIPPLQVGWDFRYLAKDAYVAMPLKTSGSIVFPERITLDAKRQVYVAWCNENLKNPASVTRLEIRRKDLEKAFAE